MLGIAATVMLIIAWLDVIKSVRGVFRIVAFVLAAILAFLWFRQWDKKKKEEAARKQEEEEAWEESVRLQAREELQRSVQAEENAAPAEEYVPETRYMNK